MREFDLGDILSITTERLVSPRNMEGIYDILGYMISQPDITTFGLLAVTDICKEDLLFQHPQLAKIEEPMFEDKCGKEVVMAWLAEQKDIYGEMLYVRPLPLDTDQDQM